MMKCKILPLAAAAMGGAALGILQTRRQRKKKEDELQNRIYVLSDHFQLLNHWLEIKGEGKSAADYFEEMGYHHIAIYGMAELANRLSEDLSQSSVCVDYGIDREICCSIARIDRVYSPDDKLPETEAIVVTPYSSFELIKSVLEAKINCPIISLEEVIWSI